MRHVNVVKIEPQSVTPYQRIAELVSNIRNARYGEMVTYSEQLIDSGDWRQFTTPIGTEFIFRRCEYDYFLAAMDADATTLRHAYIQVNDREKLMRLADITGRGRDTTKSDRRERNIVAAAYAHDPAGAGNRIRAWSGLSVVTDRTARIARDSVLRTEFKSKARGRERPTLHRWAVQWSDARPVAQAISEKLLADPDLARAVYKRLHATVMRDTRQKLKRRKRTEIE